MFHVTPQVVYRTDRRVLTRRFPTKHSNIFKSIMEKPWERANTADKALAGACSQYHEIKRKHITIPLLIVQNVLLSRSKYTVRILKGIRFSLN